MIWLNTKGSNCVIYSQASSFVQQSFVTTYVYVYIEKVKYVYGK